MIRKKPFPNLLLEPTASRHNVATNVRIHIQLDLVCWILHTNSVSFYFSVFLEFFVRILFAWHEAVGNYSKLSGTDVAKVERLN